MLFRPSPSKSGRGLERSSDYIYESSPERSGRWTGYTSGKYVNPPEHNSASAEWMRRNSVSYLYDPSKIFDPFLGYDRVESAAYQPSKAESRLVIPSRGSNRKEKKVRFDFPIATVLNKEQDRKSDHNAEHEVSSVKPTIVDAHPPRSLSTLYKHEVARSRIAREEIVSKKRLPYARHLTILTEPSRYIEREYLSRAFHNGSYERLPESRNAALIMNYSVVNRAPRRAALRL